MTLTGRTSATALLLACAGLASAFLAADGRAPSSGAERAVPNGTQPEKRLDTVYEPSGVEQLPDGRILVVDDEARRPFSVLGVENGTASKSRRLSHPSVLEAAAGKTALGKLDDLEALARDGQGRLYAITSHAPSPSGRTRNARRKLVRFEVEGDRLVEPRVIRKLRKKILARYPALDESASVRDAGDEDAFNIEALGFDAAGERLLIGLRSPLIDERAVIVVMQNPFAAFETGAAPRFAETPLLLDLDKGGIRGLAYDATLGAYLILSRREDKKGKRFKLWLWTGEPDRSPRRVRLPKPLDLEHAEGIAAVVVDGRARIMIVFDDGRRSRGEGGRYLLLDHDQLSVDGG